MYLIVSHLEKITGYMTSHFLHYANNLFQELPHVRLMRKTVWLIREINCVFIYAASDKYCVENVCYGSLYLGCDRPERIRLNMDMVLHPGFNLTTDQSRPLLLRQRSKLAKVCF